MMRTPHPTVGNNNTAGRGAQGAGRGGAEGQAPSNACCLSHVISDSTAADEGEEEAAWDNAYTQQMYMVLQRPEVYQSMGLSGPPKWFTPPDLKTYVQAMHIVGITGSADISDM